MFTSRAEHRLFLRCDNAEDRLGAKARNLGILPKSAQEVIKERKTYIERVANLVKRASVFVSNSGSRVMGVEYMRYPGSTFASMEKDVVAPDGFWSTLKQEAAQLRNLAGGDVLRSANFQIENDIKYDGYIKRQNKLLKNRVHLEYLELPKNLDYMSITALSYESREKLSMVRPDTLGLASRIDGVRSGDLAVLTVYLKKLKELDPGDSPIPDNPQSDGH